MLTGKNGILNQATNAKERTTKAEEEEKIKMAVLGSSVTDNGYTEVLDTDSFTNELQNQFGNQNLDIVANGDGSFIRTTEDTQRKYYVNDDKTVINSDNMIEISTEEQLKNFRNDVNNGNSYEGKAVLLTNDIDLNSQEWEPIGFIAPNTDDKNPETLDNKAFRGIFDGGNHTIKNLKISSTDNKYNGVFSFVVDGTIRNITIGENSEVTGSEGAGIIGYLYGFKGNISNCINYANTNRAGISCAIAGQHIISNCENYGSINSNIDTTSVGGILGGSNGTNWEQFENVSNSIINCGNYGNITIKSGHWFGGIVGVLKGEVINCCNKAEIQGIKDNKNETIGGIAGLLTGGSRIDNCYNIKSVCGMNYIGGILGRHDSYEAIVSVRNCYSIGEITGTNEVGNLVGALEYHGAKCNIINCYTKNDIFKAEDLGDAFVDNPENPNQPLLYWEVKEDDESY